MENEDFENERSSKQDTSDFQFGTFFENLVATVYIMSSQLSARRRSETRYYALVV